MSLSDHSEQIVAMRENGYKLREIAAQFGCSMASIWRVLNPTAKPKDYCNPAKLPFAPFDTHLHGGDTLTELQDDARSGDMSLIDEFITEIKRLNATICDMPIEEIEGLRSEAKEKQRAISKALHHDPLIYIYAAIVSVCNIELNHRIASNLNPEAVAATASL